ncbi:MAG: lipase maturation factor family protein [bacterium]
MDDKQLRRFKRRPLLVYDGLCFFCCRCVSFVRRFISAKLYFEPYQSLKGVFDDDTEADFRRNLHIFTEDFKVYKGAAAVFYVISLADNYLKFLWYLYQKFSLFRFASEKFYEIVSRNRRIISRLYKRHSETSYFYVSRLFLQLLGLVYFVAFLSLLLEIKGLYGASGILPFDMLFKWYRFHFGAYNFLEIPSLFWFINSNTFLLLVCWVSLCLSLMLFLGFLPLFSSFFLWVFYLSFVSAGQVFLRFQWDVLLLEVGFLALFLAPFRLSLFSKYHIKPSRVLIFLFQFLLFRVVFCSGLVKLFSGDSSWLDFSALNYHFITQPLPTFFSWFFAYLPEWSLKLLCIFVLFIELLIPWFIFLPGRFKRIAFYFINMLMVGIIISGNYCFFNFLIMAMTLFLLEERHIIFLYRFLRIDLITYKPHFIFQVYWKKLLFLSFFLSFFLASFVLDFQRFVPFISTLSVPFQHIAKRFYLINSYGLFSVMTKNRYELDIQATFDGVHWQSYIFNYKPNTVYDFPSFVIPFQPRLDWQMWFAALGEYDHTPWMSYFVMALFQQRRDVLSLLNLPQDPFLTRPPLAIRILRYRYTFSDWNKLKDGLFWDKKFHDIYLEAVMPVK